MDVLVSSVASDSFVSFEAFFLFPVKNACPCPGPMYTFRLGRKWLRTLNEFRQSAAEFGVDMEARFFYSMFIFFVKRVNLLTILDNFDYEDNW